MWSILCKQSGLFTSKYFFTFSSSSFCLGSSNILTNTIEEVIKTYFYTEKRTIYAKLLNFNIIEYIVPRVRKVYKGALLKRRMRIWREFEREQAAFSKEQQLMGMPLREEFLHRLREAEKELSKIMHSRALVRELKSSEEHRRRVFKKLSEKQRKMLERYPLTSERAKANFIEAEHALKAAIAEDKETLESLRERFGIRAHRARIRSNRLIVYIPKKADAQALRKAAAEIHSTLLRKRREIGLAMKHLEELRLSVELSQDPGYLAELGPLFLKIEGTIERASQPHLEKLANFLSELAEKGFKAGKRYVVKW
jgi:hypothetical protein